MSAIEKPSSVGRRGFIIRAAVICAMLAADRPLVDTARADEADGHDEALLSPLQFPVSLDTTAKDFVSVFEPDLYWTLSEEQRSLLDGTPLGSAEMVQAIQLEGVSPRPTLAFDVERSVEGRAAAYSFVFELQESVGLLRGIVVIAERQSGRVVLMRKLGSGEPGVLEETADVSGLAANTAYAFIAAGYVYYSEPETISLPLCLMKTA